MTYTWLVLLQMFACEFSLEEQNAAREKYNQAYEQLSSAKWEGCRSYFF